MLLNIHEVFYVNPKAMRVAGLNYASYVKPLQWTIANTGTRILNPVSCVKSSYYHNCISSIFFFKKKLKLYCYYYIPASCISLKQTCKYIIFHTL